METDKGLTPSPTGVFQRFQVRDLEFLESAALVLSYALRQGCEDFTTLTGQREPPPRTGEGITAHGGHVTDGCMMPHGPPYRAREKTVYNPNNCTHESVIACSSSERFYTLAREAERAAAEAYWCEFGWEEDDGPSPPQRYVEFVAGRRRAARILLEKAEGLRRSGY